MFKKVVITAGPTIEPIDPVRYISNRSSGKSGFHLANEAKIREIPVIIYITGPSSHIPQGVEVISIETALQMREQLHKHMDDAEVIIMAAAVSDYRTAEYQPRKIKKGKDVLTLHLVRNPDLLSELGQRKRENQILVGYAAETHNILANARQKLEKKNLDLLVLNQVSEDNPAFDADENQVFLITPNDIKKLEKMPKSELAVNLWNEIYEIRRHRSI